MLDKPNYLSLIIVDLVQNIIGGGATNKLQWKNGKKYKTIQYILVLIHLRWRQWGKNSLSNGGRTTKKWKKETDLPTNMSLFIYLSMYLFIYYFF